MTEPVAKLDVTNLVNDLTAISQLPPEQIASNVLGDLADSIKANAQSMAPVKTGRLRASINVENTGTSLVIDAGVPYGMYQEFGTGSRGEYPTGPYEIRPKNSKFLVFKVGGKTVFTKKVVHPGVKAHPYLRPATMKAVSEMSTALATNGSLLIRKGPNSAL